MYNRLFDIIPQVPGTLLLFLFLNGLFSLFFRLDNFYLSPFKFTESFLNHLHYAIKST